MDTNQHPSVRYPDRDAAEHHLPRPALGNEERDVALLGVFNGLCGVGTTVNAIIL